VDCTEAHRYGGDAVDGSLPDSVAKEFEAHLDRCATCRREVALERLSKHMVRQSIQQIPTPRSVYSLVLQTLQIERTATQYSFLDWLQTWKPLRVAVPAFAGGVIAIAFFLMVSARTDSSYQMTAHTAPNDLIHLSFENFALLKSGKLQPDMVTSAPENVGAMFAHSNLEFGVHIPRLKNCSWCGGSASECSGVKQAHLVFKIGNEIVYVFEVSDADALYGTRVSLPPAAKRALTQSGWYTDPDHPDCDVVLWKTDQAVCVAVSTMKKSQLLAMLSAQ